jgi:hypothetical protein
MEKGPDGKSVHAIDPKTGRPKFANDWKKAIIIKCERDGITLPPQKTIAHNAGEAVGIAHSWAHSKIIHKSFEDGFKLLLQQRNERQPRDLFSGAAA